MANAARTSPAFIDNIDQLPVHELQKRIEAAEATSREISTQIEFLHTRIKVLSVLEQQNAIQPEGTASIKDLLADDSYENQLSYTSSELDCSRRDSYNERQNDARVKRGNVYNAESEFRRLTSLETTGPARIGTLRTQIDQINGSMLLRITNKLFTGAREKLVSELEALQAKLAAIPGNIQNARENILFAQLELNLIRADMPYEESLHEVPSVSLSPRTEQSLLMSMERNGSRDSITLKLPLSPDDTDFSRSITFDFSDTLAFDEFIELVGKDVPIEEGMGYLGENVNYNYDFTNELVPFALEVVEINGKQMYRLPHAIWQRFNQYVFFTS